MSAIVEPPVKMPDGLQKEDDNSSAKDLFNRRPMPIFNKRHKAEDSKNSRAYCRKRSYRGSDKHAAAYKRRKKEQSIAPSRFLLGGNIRDPLNLNSLQDEEVNRRLNAVTPETSPLPTPQWKKGEVEVLLPPNIHDPLNLEADSLREDRENLAAPPTRPKKRPKRKRHKHPSESSRSDESKTEETPSADVGSAEPATSTSEPVKEGTPEPRTKKGPRRSHDDSSSKPPLSLDVSKKKQQQRKKEEDKIVSPVVPQPGAWPRRKQAQGHPPVRPPTGVAQKTPSFKDTNRRFQYGNYNRYYGYRAKQGDPRLAVLGQHAEFFKGRDVLDIGCNVGHVTLAVATRFYPRKIVGVDLDKRLIEAARANIRHYASKSIGMSGNVPIARGKLQGTQPQPISRGKGSQEQLSTSEQGIESVTTQSKDNPSKSGTGNDSYEKCDENVEVKRNLEEQDMSKSQSLEVPSHGAEPIEAHKEDASKGAEETTSEKRELSQKDENPSKSACQLDEIKASQAQSIPKESAEESLRQKDISNSKLSEPSSSTGTVDQANTFPNNISFVQGNYILGSDSYITLEQPQFDAIMCLSVTKWFHLNWGDDGLKRAFRRMFAQLRPGGVLILEPQPWQSYKKKKNLTETTWKNYQNIKLFPHKFSQFLLTEVGFSKCEILGHPSHNSKGFQRPIRVYTKGFKPPPTVDTVCKQSEEGVSKMDETGDSEVCPADSVQTSDDASLLKMEIESVTKDQVPQESQESSKTSVKSEEGKSDPGTETSVPCSNATVAERSYNSDEELPPKVSRTEQL